METTNQVLTIKNQGVQMLLNRMQSNPEEFTERGVLHPGRWDWLMEQVIRRVEHHHQNDDNYRIELPFLTNEEVDALYDKFMSIQGEAFTHRIMRELLEDGEDEVSAEYDHITDALKYGVGMKKVTVPLAVLEIAKRLHGQTR
jgi:hypothetical protein